MNRCLWFANYFHHDSPLWMYIYNHIHVYTHVCIYIYFLHTHTYIYNIDMGYFMNIWPMSWEFLHLRPGWCCHSIPTWSFSSKFSCPSWPRMRLTRTRNIERLQRQPTKFRGQIFTKNGMKLLLVWCIMIIMIIMGRTGELTTTNMMLMGRSGEANQQLGLQLRWENNRHINGLTYIDTYIESYL